MSQNDRPESRHRHRHGAAAAHGRQRRTASAGARRLRRGARRLSTLLHPADPEPPEQPPPPWELVEFLRDCGAALCRAGEPAAWVQRMVQRMGARYGVPNVETIALPTAVWVRAGEGASGISDFAPAEGATLRLDQIDRLYSLLDDIQERPVPPAEGRRRIAEIYRLPPRYPLWVETAGYAIKTVGLGMVLHPTAPALLGYLLLGLLVGLLKRIAVRMNTLQLALPVVSSIIVTVVAFRFAGPLLHTSAVQLIIPPLISFLPGSALTMGTIELASGSVVAGAGRLVYGSNVLVLLAFGIGVGVAAEPQFGIPPGVAEPAHLGWWAPWVGVLLLGFGHTFNASAAMRAVPWLLLVLFMAKAAQTLGIAVAGSQFGAFVGGVTLPLLAYAVERRRSAPPAQVTFLPAFWMLVPGSLGLSAMGRLLVGRNPGDFATLLTAFLSVVAVGLGVLVGASLLGTTRTAEPGPAAEDDEDEAAAVSP